MSEETTKPIADVTSILSDDQLDTVAGGAGGNPATSGASTGVVIPGTPAGGFWAGPNGEYTNQGKPPVIGGNPSTWTINPAKKP